jgi:hypothetical protein
MEKIQNVKGNGTNNRGRNDTPRTVSGKRTGATTRSYTQRSLEVEDKACTVNVLATRTRERHSVQCRLHLVYEIRFHRDVTIVFKWVKIRVFFTLYFNIFAFCVVNNRSRLAIRCETIVPRRNSNQRAVRKMRNMLVIDISAILI